MSGDTATFCGSAIEEDTMARPRTRPGAISGPPELVAEAIRGFARQGIAQVQITLEPNTLAGIEAFAPVIELLDAG
jgi:hypothetical protein